MEEPDRWYLKEVEYPKRGVLSWWGISCSAGGAEGDQHCHFGKRINGRADLGDASECQPFLTSLTPTIRSVGTTPWTHRQPKHYYHRQQSKLETFDKLLDRNFPRPKSCSSSRSKASRVRGLHVCQRAFLFLSFMMSSVRRNAGENHHRETEKVIEKQEEIQLHSIPPAHSSIFMIYLWYIWAYGKAWHPTFGLLLYYKFKKTSMKSVERF